MHTADKAFTVGGVSVEAGDYVLRMDQPYRTLIDMYLSVQQYAGGQPASVRRHGLDVPVHAQRDGREGRRQVASSISR